MTRFRGFDHTSRTGAKSRSMPTARSSVPIAWPTASTRRASPRAATVAAGGKCVNGRGRRWTRPPSWSRATSGETPAPSAWRAAVRRRSCPAERTFRLKSTIPPGGWSAKNAAVARSSVGSGRPTMKSWERVRSSTAVRTAAPYSMKFSGHSPAPLLLAAAQGGDGGGPDHGAVHRRRGPDRRREDSLARRLATEFGSRLLLEQVEENPFLRKFYEEPGRHAFQTQLFFLLERYRQQHELGQLDLFTQGTVADYLFAKDGIFASLTLGSDEYHLYQQIFQMLDQRLPRPDLVIYLEARPQVLLRRLRKRDRDFERGISPEYLERLTEAFREYFHRYTEAPLLVVNCSDIDFVQHGGDLADLIKEIRAMRQGVQHYIPLGSK